MTDRTVRRHAKPDKHWTITSVVAEGERMMAFAIADDGIETVYIAKPVMLRQEITIEDEGAGFYAAVRAPSPSAGEGAYPQVMAPIVWDADEQEITPDLMGVLTSLKSAERSVAAAIALIEKEMDADNE